jgi:hypothetical protein
MYFHGRIKVHQLYNIICYETGLRIGDNPKSGQFLAADTTILSLDARSILGAASDLLFYSSEGFIADGCKGQNSQEENYIVRTPFLENRRDWCCNIDDRSHCWQQHCSR